MTFAVPPVALSVSPARIAVAAPASRRLELRNVGSAAVVVDVARSGPWLSIRPERLVLHAGTKAALTLRVPARAPGDRRLVVLLRARPRAGGGVAVRLRLGVRVRIHAPGPLVRRLHLGRLRVRARKGVRMLLLSVANRGTVAERLRACLTVTLLRRGKIVSRLRPRDRGELFPGERVTVALPYAGGVRGLVTAVVKARLGAQIVRRYRIRL